MDHRNVLLCEYIHVYILCVSIYMTIVTLLLRNLDYLDDEQFSLWRQLTDSSQTSFPSQYVHRSVCSAANHADCLELPVANITHNTKCAVPIADTVCNPTST